MPENKHRLITRADFDGVVCGGLFHELGMIDDIAFAEPNDMQQGRVPVSDKDISTNLPFVDGIHLCFDHHRSELERVGEKENLIIDAAAPSAARVVYRHFGGKKAFPDILRNCWMRWIRRIPPNIPARISWFPKNGRC